MTFLLSSFDLGPETASSDQRMGTGSGRRSTFDCVGQMSNPAPSLLASLTNLLCGVMGQLPTWLFCRISENNLKSLLAAVTYLFNSAGNRITLSKRR